MANQTLLLRIIGKIVQSVGTGHCLTVAYLTKTPADLKRGYLIHGRYVERHGGFHVDGGFDELKVKVVTGLKLRGDETIIDNERRLPEHAGGYDELGVERAHGAWATRARIC